MTKEAASFLRSLHYISIRNVVTASLFITHHVAGDYAIGVSI